VGLDVDTPELTIEQAGPMPLSISFSPDGRSLAAGSSQFNSNRVTIWNARTGEEEMRVTMNGPVRGLAYSSDGTILAVGTMNPRAPVNLVDISSGNVRSRAAENCVAETLLFSADDKQLFVGNWMGSIMIFDVPNAELTGTLKGHSSVVTGLSRSPDGKTLASCSHDRSLKIWDVTRANPPQTVTIGHEYDAAWLRFSRDSKLLVTNGFDGTVRLWEVESGRLLQTLRDASGFARQMAVSPHGDSVAWADNNGLVVVYDLADQREHSIGKSDGEPLALKFSDDGQLLTIVGLKESQEKTGEELLYEQAWRFRTEEAKSEPKQLGSIDLLPTNPTPPPGFPLFRHSSVVPDSRRRLSHNYRMLAQAHGSSVRLWDIDTGRLHVLDHHTEQVMNLAFSFMDDLLASCSQDRSICLWRTSTGKLVQTLMGRTWPLSVALSPDSKTLATGDIDGKVTLWDLRTYTEILALDVNAEVVTSLSFAPDGRALAAGTLGGKVYIWRAPQQ
jgi:WD40 repeat protein